MKRAILLAAYGASNPEGKKGLSEFESLCRTTFPGLSIRWAFTSSRQRSRLALQKRKSDSVVKALMRLYYEQFAEIAIQPLQLIPGSEYEDLLKTVDDFKNSTGVKCAMGRPLISQADEVQNIAEELSKYAKSISCDNENVLFMAHGAKHEAGELFSMISKELDMTFPGVYLAAMSSPPFLKDIMPRLTTRKVCLAPLLSVVGLHALRDMAGDDENSWKSQIILAGHECRPVLKGLLQSTPFSGRWLDKLQNAISELG